MEKEHPSYGMLSFDRVSGCCGTSLFGSSIKHRDTIIMELKHGYVDRHLNRDWYHTNGTICRVEMSASQFAEVITSFNIGEGVPVTLLYTEKDGKMPECPYENKAELHKKEYREHLKEVYRKSNELIDSIRDKFNSKKPLNKKDKEEIMSMLLRLENDLMSNQTFQLEQFQEQMEATTTEAKSEIEAFYQNRMLNIPEIDRKESPVYLDTESIGDDNE